MDHLDSRMIFREVARTGSLSATARTLRMPLAKVCHKVAELETRIEAQLFTRTTGRLILTPQGEDYVRATQTIIDGMKDVRGAVLGEHSAMEGHQGMPLPTSKKLH